MLLTQIDAEYAILQPYVMSDDFCFILVVYNGGYQTLALSDVTRRVKSVYPL
jgi:hypothetical protein